MISDRKQKRILFVDDEENVRRLVVRIMAKNDFQCDEAPSGPEALAMLEETDYALMIADINMPGMTGIELLDIAKKKYRDLAVIMLTAVDNRDIAIKTLELGAFGYVIKPFEQNEVVINAINALKRRQLEIENRHHRENLETLVDERTVELRKAEKAARRAQEETILCLSRAAEFRDNETAQHAVRMSHYCKLLALKADLPEDECEQIRLASPLHDVGKIGIPDAILFKPSSLTDEEFDTIKEHSEIGYRILAGLDSRLLRLGGQIALTHHEKFDGSGYPKGLAGEDIPFVGRIAAICDVFDAMTMDRVYRAAMPVEIALQIMKEEGTGHFDPKLLALFFESMDEVLEIKNRFTDL